MSKIELATTAASAAIPLGRSYLIGKSLDREPLENIGHVVKKASEFIGDHPIPTAIAAAIAAGLGAVSLRNKIRNISKE